MQNTETLITRLRVLREAYPKFDTTDKAFELSNIAGAFTFLEILAFVLEFQNAGKPVDLYWWHKKGKKYQKIYVISIANYAYFIDDN